MIVVMMITLMEKVKAEASDCFKRAGFKWGIGRGLYTSPKIRTSDLPLEFQKAKYFDGWKHWL